ncbi:MAG: hypothetical protein IJ501_05965 [Bacilli bacterium]|nr:hypothetical protein [Bacilli bacterium]
MKNKELKKILDKIDNNDIKNYLLDILTYNENIMNDFRGTFINYFPKITKEEYNRKIYSAIQLASGRDGYIDYREASEYTRLMYGFIRESRNLLDNRNYESAFDIVETILDSIPETDIDDSNGSTGEVASDCIEVIEDILGYSLIDDLNISFRILNFVLDEIKTGIFYNYGIELYPLLDYFIDEKRYLKEIENTLNSFLKHSKETGSIRGKYNSILSRIKNIEELI